MTGERSHLARVEASRQVYANAWFAIREDTLRGPAGEPRQYAVIDGPDIAMTIPLADGGVHLVDQYRHPVGGRRWEFPSGSVDDRDADPAAAAMRELREETGLTARTLTLLGTLDVLPSTTTQRCWVFLATNLTQGPPSPEAEETDLRSAWFARGQFEQMVAGGRITDSRTIAAWAQLLVAERHGDCG